MRDFPFPSHAHDLPRYTRPAITVLIESPAVFHEEKADDLFSVASVSQPSPVGVANLSVLTFTSLSNIQSHVPRSRLTLHLALLDPFLECRQDILDSCRQEKRQRRKGAIRIIYPDKVLLFSQITKSARRP